MSKISQETAREMLERIEQLIKFISNTSDKNIYRHQISQLASESFLLISKARGEMNGN